MKKIWNKWYVRYPFFFCVTVVIAFALLLSVALLPQDNVDANVLDSAEKMLVEGTYPIMGDRNVGSSLDNFTDAIMLMQSKSMSRRGLRSTLSNPMYIDESGDPVQSLYAYASDPDVEINNHYYRYWMGFRAIVRLLLVFMDYYQIRRYVAFLFLLLFSILLCQISRTLNQKTALAFALSIILVKPDVICNSLQYSCCYFIAFLAMLLVPWVSENPKYEKLFFMEVGMITMYFDFYTTPILTFGMPMVYLYLLKASKEEAISGKRILQNGIVWLVSYVLMWLAKLTLTTLLTTYNGLENGIGSLKYNLNERNQVSANLLLRSIDAFERVLRPVFPDTIDKRCALVVLAVLVILIIIAAYRGRIAFDKCKKYVSIYVISLFPLIWYVASARPLQNHFIFQYRSVPVIFWVIGAYLCLIGNHPKSSVSLKN